MFIDYELLHNAQTAFSLLFFCIGLALFVLAFRKKRFPPGLGGAVTWVVALVGLLAPASFSVDAYVISGDRGAAWVQKMTLFGEGQFSFANGQKVTFPAAARPKELVVNNADFPAVILPIHYAAEGIVSNLQEGDFKPVATFNPFSGGYTDLWIQYAGKEQPPEKAKIYGYGDLRYWLTWEPEKKQ
ncbi:MAG: hypothetical protein EPN97_03900 [Alphaproteobacteria bacterium]|nr:MAG: hypothetical protein EPN97_03900 [Alphaproteobacteria bacterium]